MFLVLYFDPSAADGMVHVRNSFFAVNHLHSSTSLGLFESFKGAVEYMEIKQWKSRMIGFGCDGTNANIASGGLRGHLTHEMPWIFVFWCLAHRLELAIKVPTLVPLMISSCVFTFFTRIHPKNAGN